MQDLLLGRRVGAHEAARVYNAAPKNKVLHWRHAITDYLMEGLWYQFLDNDLGKKMGKKWDKLHKN